MIHSPDGTTGQGQSKKKFEIFGKHLIGREHSRHPFAVILLVTALWRLPSCFAAMLFFADTIWSLTGSLIGFEEAKEETRNEHKTMSYECTRILLNNTNSMDTTRVACNIAKTTTMNDDDDDDDEATCGCLSSHQRSRA